ncbi:MAG: RNA polymerase sigma factor [Armatimonadota bacterium]
MSQANDLSDGKDRALVDAALKGDEHALQKLSRALLPLLLDFCRGLCFFYRLPVDKAGDIVQDVMVDFLDDDLVQLRHWFDNDGGKLVSYAVMACRNKAVDLVREAVMLSRLSQKMLEESDETDCPCDIVDETVLEFRECWCKLPEEYKEVLWERFVEKTSAKDVALRKGSTPDAVNSKVYRAKEALMALMVTEAE